MSTLQVPNSKLKIPKSKRDVIVYNLKSIEFRECLVSHFTLDFYFILFFLRGLNKREEIIRACAGFCARVYVFVLRAHTCTH